MFSICKILAGGTVSSARLIKKKEDEIPLTY